MSSPVVVAKVAQRELHDAVGVPRARALGVLRRRARRTGSPPAMPIDARSAHLLAQRLAGVLQPRRAATGSAGPRRCPRARTAGRRGRRGRGGSRRPVAAGRACGEAGAAAGRGRSPRAILGPVGQPDPERVDAASRSARPATVRSDEVGQHPRRPPTGPWRPTAPAGTPMQARPAARAAATPVGESSMATTPAGVDAEGVHRGQVHVGRGLGRGHVVERHHRLEAVRTGHAIAAGPPARRGGVGRHRHRDRRRGAVVEQREPRRGAGAPGRTGPSGPSIHSACSGHGGRGGRRGHPARPASRTTRRCRSYGSQRSQARARGRGSAHTSATEP